MRILVCAALIFAAACTRKSPTLSEAAGVRIAGWEELRLENPKPFQIAGHRVREYAVEKDGVEARIRILEGVSPQSAEQLRKQKLFSVDTLFRERRNPYPGDFSETIRKPGQLMPVISKSDDEKSQLTRILAPANSRKSLGVGAIAEFHFQHLWLMIYCKQTEIAVQVEAYMPRAKAKDTDLNKWLDPARCG